MVAQLPSDSYHDTIIGARIESDHHVAGALGLVS